MALRLLHAIPRHRNTLLHLLSMFYSPTSASVSLSAAVPSSSCRCRIPRTILSPNASCLCLIDQSISTPLIPLCQSLSVYKLPMRPLLHRIPSRQGFIQPSQRGEYSPPEKFYSPNQALLTPPSGVVYHKICALASPEILRTVA